MNRFISNISLFIFGFLFLCASPASAVTCTLTVPTSQQTIDGSLAPYNQIGPGQTICLAAGTRTGVLNLVNLRGASGNPVIVTNSGGKVVIDAGNVPPIIAVRTSTYIRITGSGSSDQYGIELKNADMGLRSYDANRQSSETPGLELDHLEVHHIGTSTGGIGFNDGHYVHHNYLHDVGSECIYIGNSYWQPGYPTISNIEVSHNRLERCGWDGIQIGSAGTNVKIHHNYLKDIGTSAYVYGGNSGVGLMINLGTTGDWYNNTIINTRKHAIYNQGIGTIRIFNNLIVNAGTIAGGGGNGINNWKDTTTIFNNTIINSNGYGIDIPTADISNGKIFNNLVVASKLSPQINNRNFPKTNNLELTTISGFVNPSANDYHLTSSSPAINQGTSTGAPAFDLEDKSRPQGSAYDIGAYEYGGSLPPPTPTTSIPTTAPSTAPSPTSPPSCFTSSGLWQNIPLPTHSNSFNVDFDTTPLGNQIDALTMLSGAAGTDYPHYAVLIRFNNLGFIDARNGAVYAAVNSIPYTTNTRYHFKLQINQSAHTYSVWVTPPGASPQLLATNYAFRTEQATVTNLTHWALRAGAGSHQVCYLTLDNLTPTPAVSLKRILFSWFTNLFDQNNDGKFNSLDFLKSLFP